VANYWKKAIQIAIDMGVDTMNSAFGRWAIAGPLQPFQLLRRAVHG
jgi:hypothetical protein